MAKQPTDVPNCLRCGGTTFVDVPYRTPRDGVVVYLLCCEACMGVVGAMRNFNLADMALTPRYKVDWVPERAPAKSSTRKSR